jgi:secreted PhoX family phosphatase
MRRRDFVRGLGLAGVGTAVATAGNWSWTVRAEAVGGYGPLQPADANGMMLPAGFTSRIIATTGQPVAATGYVFPASPDGGGCIPFPGGGWVYVSNSEVGSLLGGVSVIRFDDAGQIVEAWRGLSGTSKNCSGSVTPWATFLSCEETPTGRVWEVDPLLRTTPPARGAMGRFNHECAVVDVLGRAVYMTEDQPDGALYRYRPTAWPSLAAGTLALMTEESGVLGWATVPRPQGGSADPTRYQVPTVKRFNGGEGACFRDGRLSFTTKGDNRVWSYVPATGVLTIDYEAPPVAPILKGVDGIVVSAAGERFIAEDGGNMEVVLLEADGSVSPFLQLSVTGSELTGLAFDPSGSRLYVASQRNPGQVFEVQGAFNGAGCS